MIIMLLIGCYFWLVGLWKARKKKVGVTAQGISVYSYDYGWKLWSVIGTLFLAASAVLWLVEHVTIGIK